MSFSRTARWYDALYVHGLGRPERLPTVSFVEGDMADFDLGQRFDAVTCLFSSIAYMATEDRLRAAVASMAAHLEPGGVLVGEGARVERLEEQHVLGLFTWEQYRAAFEAAGLACEIDEVGILGRGLVIGVSPS